MKRENMAVILASASPRRTELLEQAGISHLVMPSGCEEITHSQIPEEVVKELSARKAEDVSARYQAEHPGEEFMVIGSDTVVAAEGGILGKPKDEEEAFRMISLLQGRSHQVYTGVTLLAWKNGQKVQNTFAECSQVKVYPMSEEEIRAYIATGDSKDKAGDPIRYSKNTQPEWADKAGDPIRYSFEWQDKAGGYGIQTAFGAKYIRRIEGDYYNVVGLPVSRVYHELKEMGYI